jgi:hypothetical protein
MPTARKKHAVKRSIRKAQRGRRFTSSRARAQVLPYSRWRRGAGSSRSITTTSAKKGGVERIAGQRPDRTWATAGWLISKDMAHVERGRLVPDTVDARKVLSTLGVTPRRVSGDRFQAKNRPKVPERKKRKRTMRRA